MESSLFPVTAGDIFTAHEDFAVFGDLEFAVRENLTDRAFRRAKRVIQAYQRGGLRQAVALNNGITQSLEEVLGFIRKGRTTGNQCPKLPAKPAVASVERPLPLKDIS